MNYPKILIRKVILGSIALSLTLICLISTTFAWFARNQNAWIQDFDIDLTGVEGLQLSLDGNSWSQDITSEELKKSIAESVENFDKIEFGCVSVKHNTDGTIKFDQNKQVQFGYDNVVQDPTTKTFSHETLDAEANKDKGYIKFDLYVRSVASYEEKRTYSLRMTDVTDITSDPVNVKLANTLTTREIVGEGAERHYTDNYKEYHTGDNLLVDISNAVRFGMYTVDQDNDGKFSRYNSFDVYEMTNDYDLGSSALEGSTDNIHDKTKNAMYTYYNSYFGRYPFTEAAQANGDAFKTKTREQLLERELGRFNYVETKDSYNIIKLELYIWLEGWDADYFVGIPENTKISVDLEFGIEVVTS